MQQLPRILLHSTVALLPLACLLSATEAGKTSFPSLNEAEAPPALVRSVRVVPARNGPEIEIIATRPIVPDIAALKNPERLVIDLAKTYISSPRRVFIRDEQLRAVRVDQFRLDPAITRIVLDLRKPSGYTWDSAGNRLMIRLGPPELKDVEAGSLPAAPAAPVMVPTYSSPRPVSASEGNLTGGSSVTAGADTTVLRLPRGGEIHVCPGTTVSMTYSQNGRDLMLGMSTGSLEAHYRVGAAADSLITPDFRILMAGPGEFHYSFNVDSRGNTCVHSLPGNTSSVIVSELMGAGSYQLKPTDRVVFHEGHLTSVAMPSPDGCGCPVTSVPVLRTSLPTENPELPKLEDQPRADRPQVAIAAPETAPLPPSKPNDIHVQVDAPFVFRATDPPPVRTAPPAPTTEIADLTLAYLPPSTPLEMTVLPPPRHTGRGFFGKLKGFFGAIFQ